MRRPSALSLPLLLVGLTGAAGCHCASCQSCEENKQLVRRYFEVFNTGAVDELQGIVSPEYSEVYEGAVYPIGLEGAEAHVRGIRTAFPDLTITID